LKDFRKKKNYIRFFELRSFRWCSAMCLCASTRHKPLHHPHPPMGVQRIECRKLPLRGIKYKKSRASKYRAMPP
jgi:hypothetical protein